MTIRRFHLFLFIIYFFISWIGGWSLPSIAAQSTRKPIQESVPTRFEGGISLQTRAGNPPIPAPLLHTTVTQTISGLIARTIVSQQFSNPDDEWAEGVYVFPLPAQAAVDHLRMKIGERIIEGQIRERAEAKKTYAKVKAKGQRTSLVEQERPNIFTASVANIAPHAMITIDIEYQENVRYDQGRFSLRFPMVVGPRYIPGQPEEIQDSSSSQPDLGGAYDTDQIPDASRITPPVQHPSDGLINPINLRIDLAPGVLLQKIESPTHPITIAQQDRNSYQISLKNGITHANRDFELTWTPLSNETPQASLFTEQHDGETFLFMHLMPPTTPSSDLTRIPREVVFVIDTSGSMAGKSLKEAKAALSLALSRLSPQDSFNIIQFNSVTHQLYSTARQVSESRVHEAQRYVNGLQASGGTEMLPPLQQALAHRPAKDIPQRLCQIIFITDGLVGNEDALFSLLRRDLQEARLFTVGIGSAPNSYFMNKAAQFGKGTFTHVGTTTEVQDKMDRLFLKLEHLALTDITIQSAGLEFEEILPNPLPDLYLGEPLTIAFRTRTLPASITITGKQAGRPWESTQSIDAAKPRSGIAIHWGQQKISQLMDQGIQEHNNTLLRQSIVNLALKHHLVSRYTSLVAVDVTPARPKTQGLHIHALKTNLPDGMKHEAIFGWPQTATPSILYLFIGSIMIGVAWIWTKRQLTR